MDDVLDIPIEVPEKDAEVQFDDYRIFNFDPQILSIFIFVFGIVYSALSILKQKNIPFIVRKMPAYQVIISIYTATVYSNHPCPIFDFKLIY
ncbi:hypothetical protein OKW96_19730 [Sphingobacterium sp. KU25419]|nr:hypothetical protein OKW96_19730 [Sphingobacterium sp. KU25419]